MYASQGTKSIEPKSLPAILVLSSLLLFIPAVSAPVHGRTLSARPASGPAVFSAAAAAVAAPNGSGGLLRAPAALAGTGSISGAVHEADGVTPIAAGGWVEVLEAATGAGVASAAVNPVGTYTVVGLEEGAYRVHATGIGYAREFYNEAGASFHNGALVQVAGGDTPNVNFTLDPGGTITGFVFAADGVTPLADVSIGTDFAWVHACSAFDGSYKLSYLPLNVPLKIQASGQDWCAGPDNYVREWWRETANYDLATPVVLTLTKHTVIRVNFTLEAGGSISGYVFEADGTTPIEGAAVWAGEHSTGNGHGAATNSSGYYQIQGLAQGDYRVEARAAGRALEFYDNAGPDGNLATLVSVIEGSDTPFINFGLDPGGAISGKVYAAVGGAPLPNIFVGLDIAWLSACTNLSGEYTILHVPLQSPQRIYAGGPRWCAGGSLNLTREWWQEAFDYASGSPVVLTAELASADDVDFTLLEPVYLPLIHNLP